MDELVWYIYIDTKNSLKKEKEKWTLGTTPKRELNRLDKNKLVNYFNCSKLSWWTITMTNVIHKPSLKPWHMA